MDIPIIFEDSELTVINKPSGIVVNRSLNDKADTLQDWIDARDYFKQIPKSADSFFMRSGIVHRLDKDTSGILLIAKNADSFTVLQSQFTNRQVTKKYLALVHGKVIPPKGEINAAVGRLPWDRTKFGVISWGREALTYYEVLDYYRVPQMPSGTPVREILSLVRATPHTGRTHQIRIHFKYLGFPVLVDKLYAGKKNFEADSTYCPRLFLHAHYLSFFHPKSNEKMEFTSELPPDLKKVIEKLEKVSEKG